MNVREVVPRHPTSQEGEQWPGVSLVQQFKRLLGSPERGFRRAPLTLKRQFLIGQFGDGRLWPHSDSLSGRTVPVK